MRDEETKQCKDCGEVKSLSEFPHRGGKKEAHRIRGKCRACANKQGNENKKARLAGVNAREVAELSGVTKKRCTKCKRVKPVEAFAYSKATRDGRVQRCKEHQRVRKSSVCPAILALNPPTEKRCTKCRQVKSLAEFHVARLGRFGREARCAECSSNYHRQRREANPVVRAMNNAAQRRYCSKPEVRAKSRAYGKAARRKLRNELLEAYGGKCACCGESRKEFLAIDHVNGDGGQHRKEVGARGVYNWLRKNGYPKNGFRLLCHSCNLARGLYGYCPHELEGARVAQ